jgi:transcription-repair coupling factor (superfamily II helicase)
MTASPARRRNLASSPFQPDPEPAIAQVEVGDLVNHDSYGVGRVIGVETGAVTVDFRTQTVRITSPFRKLALL